MIYMRYLCKVGILGVGRAVVVVLLCHVLEYVGFWIPSLYILCRSTVRVRYLQYMEMESELMGD